MTFSIRYTDVKIRKEQKGSLEDNFPCLQNNFYQSQAPPFGYIQKASSATLYGKVLFQGISKLEAYNFSTSFVLFNRKHTNLYIIQRNILIVRCTMDSTVTLFRTRSSTREVVQSLQFFFRGIHIITGFSGHAFFMFSTAWQTIDEYRSVNFGF